MWKQAAFEIRIPGILSIHQTCSLLKSSVGIEPHGAHCSLPLWERGTLRHAGRLFVGPAEDTLALVENKCTKARFSGFTIDSWPRTSGYVNEHLAVCGREVGRPPIGLHPVSTRRKIDPVGTALDWRHMDTPVSPRFSGLSHFSSPLLAVASSPTRSFTMGSGFRCSPSPSETVQRGTQW